MANRVGALSDMFPAAERARSTWRAQQETVSQPVFFGLSSCLSEQLLPSRTDMVRREKGQRNVVEKKGIKTGI